MTLKRSQSAVSRDLHPAQVRDSVWQSLPEAVAAEVSVEVERLLGAIAALRREQSTFDPVKGSLSGCTCEVEGPPSERENQSARVSPEGQETFCVDRDPDRQMPQKAIWVLLLGRYQRLLWGTTFREGGAYIGTQNFGDTKEFFGIRRFFSGNKKLYLEF